VTQTAAGEPRSGPESAPVLALDFGAARTGVAVCDPTGTVVRPLPVVAKAASAPGMDEVAALVGEHRAVRVVVGLPVGPSGDTAQTARSRSFAARLRQRLDIPVELHDERFTSRMADQTRAATGTDAARDSLAACHILESWLAAR
jgi:putative Holliday junction resolvase